MKKRKSSAIHPAGCPNGPHQMAIIDPQLFGPVDDCVLLQASGDGMRNAGIHSGDYLILYTAQEVRNGDIACILHQGEYQCRRVFIEGDMVRIRREDGVTPDIVTSDCSVLGVLVGTMRSYRCQVPVIQEVVEKDAVPIS